MESKISKHNRYIEEIKKTLKDLEGQTIHVKANLGRSKIFEKDALLYQCHDNLFIIEIEERRRKKSRNSYQYIDVLTGSLEIYDAKTKEMIFEDILDDLSEI
ncbi:MAG: Veg family protein [Coriobacteriales bacterium]|nr:Veg family protein [Coriobacteriales bacterium]